MIQIRLLPRREQSVFVANAVSVQAHSLQVVTGCCAQVCYPSVFTSVKHWDTNVCTASCDVTCKE